MPEIESSMREGIMRWFVQGEVGISSKAIASAILGIESTEHNYPSDPADFNRCLLLLTVVPEARNHLDKVRKLSPVWNALIDNWKEIEDCFLNEVGLNWELGNRAVKTYNLMQMIIKKARVTLEAPDAKG